MSTIIVTYDGLYQVNGSYITEEDIAIAELHGEDVPSVRRSGDVVQVRRSELRCGIFVLCFGYIWQENSLCMLYMVLCDMEASSCPPWRVFEAAALSSCPVP